MTDEPDDRPTVLTTRPLRVLRAYDLPDLIGVVRCFEASVRVIGARFYASGQISAWAPVTADLDAWARRFHTGKAFVVDASASIAGFVRIEADGLVDLLYVHPEHERCGLGRALIVAACDWAQRRGASTTTAEVSLAARPLFEAMGFQVLQQRSVERRDATFVNFFMARASKV